MDLADLYLRGDGVARNCAQARVLLSVASEKGNTEAMQKLGELNRTDQRPGTPFAFLFANYHIA